jgi:hypothetical protein
MSQEVEPERHVVAGTEKHDADGEFEMLVTPGQSRPPMGSGKDSVCRIPVAHRRVSRLSSRRNDRAAFELQARIPWREFRQVSTMGSTPAVPARWAFATRLDLRQCEEAPENKANPLSVMRRHFQR